MNRTMSFLVCVLTSTFSANAEVLWNQPANTNFPVFSTINQQFNDNPDVSTYVVNDITVGASGWTINSLTEWFSTFGRGSNPATLPVVFNLFSKTGALPRGTDDPTAGLGLKATITADGPYFQFTMVDIYLTQVAPTGCVSLLGPPRLPLRT